MGGLPRLVVAILICVPGLLACQMFGGGATRHEHVTAQQRPNSDCQRLAPLVVNPDGSLTRPELEAGLKAEFKKWDKDGNGVLSPVEVEPLNEY